MKIYIDVTSIIHSPFRTGIQRVTEEIVGRLKEKYDADLILFWQMTKEDYFYVIDFEDYLECRRNYKSRRFLFHKKKLYVEDMEPNGVFFDIDGAWVSGYQRKDLLPKLHEKGIKIVSNIYDIIPITYPQFVPQNAIDCFKNYFYAHAIYDDIVIVNAEHTTSEINRICGEKNIPLPSTCVVPLGSYEPKIVNANNAKKDINDIYGKYILMVGTVAPRKGHEFVLDTFEKYFTNTDINLVVVGGDGWNMDAVIDRFDSHPLKDKKIYRLKGVDDSELQQIYDNARVMLIASEEEGFGLPIIEALRRGIPTVASDIEVFREVGKDYCDYFEYGNEESLSNVLNKIFDDEQYYRNRINDIKSVSFMDWNESYKLFENVIDGLMYSEDLANTQRKIVENDLYKLLYPMSKWDKLKYSNIKIIRKMYMVLKEFKYLKDIK